MSRVVGIWLVGLLACKFPALPELASDDEPPTCTDGEQNQAESDVDCGGECAPCPPHRHCAGPADCSTGLCTDTFCALASGPPSWIPGTTLPTFTGSMGAGHANGTVWVVDGRSVAFWTGTSWTEITSTADPRTLDLPTTSHAIVGDGANLWALGGRDSDGERADRARGLLPAAAAWTVLAPITPARSSLAAAVGPDGKIYAIGGGVGVETSMSSFNNVVESYTPPPVSAGSQAWAPSPVDLPFGVFGHAAASVGGDLYVVGGTAFTGTLQSLLRWKPGEPAWTPRANLAGPRTGLGAAGAPDGRLYAVAGTDGTNRLATVEAYAPDADRWFAVAALPGGGRSGLGVTVGPDGRIWAIGGTAAASVGTVEIYGPVLRLNPEHGPAGTQVQIAGSNFAAEATVTIHVGSLASPAVGTSQTSAAGAMQTPVAFVVPGGMAAGTQLVIHAVDNRSVFPVRQVFTVD